MRDIEREMAMDLQHDEAIERGKACANCAHCTIAKYPHNWYRESYYCKLKKEYTQRYGFCDEWEDVDDAVN